MARVLTRKQRRSNRIHDLEIKHQDAIHKTNMISRDEESRRLKLQLLILGDQKSAAEDQLVAKEETMKSLAAKYHTLQAELDATKETMRKQDGQLKTQARDFAHLQVCPATAFRNLVIERGLQPDVVEPLVHHRPSCRV